MEYVIESTGLFVEAEKVRLAGWLPNTGPNSIFNSWGKEVGNGKLCVWKVRKLDFENQTVETQYPSGYIVNHKV